MANAAKHVHYRLEDEYIDMIDKLVSLDEEEAKKQNRPSENKTDILKRCIKNEYANVVNGDSKNAFNDIVEVTMDSKLSEQTIDVEEYVNAKLEDMETRLYANQVMMIHLLRMIANLNGAIEDDIEPYMYKNIMSAKTSYDNELTKLVENAIRELEKSKN